MPNAELKSAIEKSIAAVKAEIAELKIRAKDRMNDRAALFGITQELRALNVRLEELQRNLRQ